jgi:hypothetical protein
MPEVRRGGSRPGAGRPRLEQVQKKVRIRYVMIASEAFSQQVEELRQPEESTQALLERLIKAGIHSIHRSTCQPSTEK